MKQATQQPTTKPRKAPTAEAQRYAAEARRLERANRRRLRRMVLSP